MNASILNSSVPEVGAALRSGANHEYSFNGDGKPTAQATWTTRSTFNIVTKLLAMVTNSTLVYLFFRYRSVRIPFNVYAVNLCLANLAYLFIFYPTMLYNEWRNTSSPPSQLLCVFHRVVAHSIAPVIVHTHLTIAVNRLWAILAPISYRKYHRSDSLMQPTLICVGIWIYIFVFIGPGVVIDALTPPRPSEGAHCSANIRAPTWYADAGVLGIYFIPLCLALLMYPVIFGIVLIKSRIRPGQVGSAAHPAKIHTHDGSPHNGSAAPSSHPNDPSPGTKKISCFGRIAHQSGRQFLMLSLLTLNVAIGLFPAMLYYTLVEVSFIAINPSGMFLVVGTLYALGTILDPILFLVSVKTFKDAFKKDDHWSVVMTDIFFSVITQALARTRHAMHSHWTWKTNTSIMSALQHPKLSYVRSDRLSNFTRHPYILLFHFGDIQTPRVHCHEYGHASDLLVDLTMMSQLSDRTYADPRKSYHEKAITLMLPTDRPQPCRASGICQSCAVVALYSSSKLSSSALTVHQTTQTHIR